jgi:hypothetical protein
LKTANINFVKDTNEDSNFLGHDVASIGKLAVDVTER